MGFAQPQIISCLKKDRSTTLTIYLSVSKSTPEAWVLSIIGSHTLKLEPLVRRLNCMQSSIDLRLSTSSSTCKVIYWMGSSSNSWQTHSSLPHLLLSRPRNSNGFNSEINKIEAHRICKLRWGTINQYNKAWWWAKTATNSIHFDFTNNLLSID